MGTDSAVKGLASRRALMRTAVIGALVLLALQILVSAAGWEDALPLLPLLSFPAGVFFCGWAVTWLTRRQANRALAREPEAPPLLSGARLRAVRIGWLVLFGAAVIVYADAVAVIWREANGIYHPAQNDEMAGVGALGLTTSELWVLVGNREIPGWYPWLVVARSTAIFVTALAIAWSVFARRPRHWMAYFVAGLIALGPIGDLDAVRDQDTAVRGLALVLSQLLAVGFLGFLWTFPDGRFRGTYLRYLTALVVVLVAVELIAPEAGWGWALGFNLLLVIIAGGVATQVWRYRHVPLENKRLARWNLGLLGSIPLWMLFYPTLYHTFERGASRWVFVWHQVHLAIYLAAPVLLGLWILYLMRSQGWWDAQRFWRRTTLFGIFAPLFLAAYGVTLVTVTAVAETVLDAHSQTVAVLAATAVVAFALRPAQRLVTGWVDRRFFPSRLIAEEAVTRFDDRVRQEADPGIVRQELLAVVGDTFAPQHADVWVGGGGSR